MQSSITSFLFYLDERLFTHIANDLNQLVTNLFRFLHRVSFGINTDNRFRIALTQMHPFFREVDLHTIDIGDIILGNFSFTFAKIASTSISGVSSTFFLEMKYGG